MTNKVNINSRFSSLLYFLIFIFLSCKNNSDSKDFVATIINDKTLEISVSLPPGKAIQLNYVDENLSVKSLLFDNNDNQDKNIVKEIDKTNNRLIINYLGFLYNNGELNEFTHDYLVDTSVNRISFKYLISGDIQIDSNEKNGILLLDSIVNKYKVVYGIKNKLNKDELQDNMEKVFNSFKNTSDKNLLDVNQLLYNEALQRISSVKSTLLIQEYLKNISDPIYSIQLRELLLKFNSREFNNCNYEMPLHANQHYEDL